MIRNRRIFVGVMALGALSSLGVLTAWTIQPPSALWFFPSWFFVLCVVFNLAYFAYYGLLVVSGRPIPIARWARNISDRQLWLIKGAVFAILLGISLAIIFVKR